MIRRGSFGALAAIAFLAAPTTLQAWTMATHPGTYQEIVASFAKQGYQVVQELEYKGEKFADFRRRDDGMWITLRFEPAPDKSGKLVGIDVPPSRRPVGLAMPVGF